MKTTLIRINSSEPGTYYIGLGFGFELERHHGWFVGLIIQFFPWTIRIGLDREIELIG